MIRTLTALSFSALFSMTSFGYAQESTTSESSETEPALDMGEPVTDGPKIGERYAKETYGSWELACLKTAGDTDPCSLVQILTDNVNNPTAEISLFRIAGAGQAVAGITVVVPLETSLPAQLTISVDEAPGKRYIYSYCSQIGCVAQIGLTEEDVAAFKKGNMAIVSLVPAQAPDQVVSLEMPLNGFTAGFEKVDVVKN